MNEYDIIVVLGYGFSKDWSLPQHVSLTLGKAAQLYFDKVASKIVVCGQWSINWDHQGIKPPTTEAEAMKRVLVNLGVPDEDILKEDWSKDTIGNAFFLKTKIMQERAYRKILILHADFKSEHVNFIFNKVFEQRYTVDFIAIPTESGKNKDFLQTQEGILAMQKGFLHNMERGDDTFLAEKLYNDPYYQRKRPEAVAKAAMGQS